MEQAGPLKPLKKIGRKEGPILASSRDAQDIGPNDGEIAQLTRTHFELADEVAKRFLDEGLIDPTQNIEKAHRLVDCVFGNRRQPRGIDTVIMHEVRRRTAMIGHGRHRNRM